MAFLLAVKAVTLNDHKSFQCLIESWLDAVISDTCDS